MQTIFFAYLYVAGRGLAGRLPAEIVADCRWASAGVWLRWLFVWLFLSRPSGSAAELVPFGFDTHNIAAGGGHRFFPRATGRKPQFRAQFWLLWLLPSSLIRLSGWRLQKPLEERRPLGVASVRAPCCRIMPSLDQGAAAARRRWPDVSAGLSLGRPAQRTPGRTPTGSRIKTAELIRHAHRCRSQPSASPPMSGSRRWRPGRARPKQSATPTGEPANTPIDLALHKRTGGRSRVNSAIEDLFSVDRS